MADPDFQLQGGQVTRKELIDYVRRSDPVLADGPMITLTNPSTLFILLP